MPLPHFPGNRYKVEEIVKLIKYYIGIEPVFYSPINGCPVYERHVDITKNILIIMIILNYMLKYCLL